MKRSVASKCVDHIRGTYRRNRENVYCVYKISSPSGLTYIGKTWHPKSRIRKHLNMNTSSNPYMLVELLRYGPKNMDISIVEDDLTSSEAKKREKEMIKSLPPKRTMNVIHTSKFNKLN